jgi:hypothetical protein
LLAVQTLSSSAAWGAETTSTSTTVDPFAAPSWTDLPPALTATTAVGPRPERNPDQRSKPSLPTPLTEKASSPPWSRLAEDQELSAAILLGAAFDLYELGGIVPNAALMLRWSMADPLELLIDLHIYRPGAEVDLSLPIVEAPSFTLSVIAPLSFFSARDVGWAGGGLGLELQSGVLSVSAHTSLARVDATISDQVYQRNTIVPGARLTIAVPIAWLHLGLVADAAILPEIGALLTTRLALAVL